jgi:membrane protease YdiL (CAAX protease family)
MKALMSATASSAGSKPKIARAVLALFLPPVSMAVVFGAFGAYFAARYGLKGAAVGKAIEPISAVPVVANMAVIFAITWASMRKDGHTLATVGWRVDDQSYLKEIAIGVAAGVAFAVLDRFFFFPLIRLFPQMSPVPFDPTLPSVPLAQLLIIQVVGAWVEDTLYRGYGLLQTKARLGTVSAIAITTIAHSVFACAQGPSVMVWHLFIGTYLAVLSLWRGNLFTPFACHVVFTLAPRLLSYT